MSENKQANNSDSQVNLNSQQVKILRLLSIIFLLNALFIFISPWFMPGVNISLEGASLQISIVRQAFFLSAAGLLLAAAFVLSKKAIFKNQTQNWYKLYIVNLCLYEAIIVLSMLSMSAYSDFIIYLLLGLVGFYKLIGQIFALNIRANS